MRQGDGSIASEIAGGTTLGLARIPCLVRPSNPFHQSTLRRPYCLFDPVDLEFIVENTWVQG